MRNGTTATAIGAIAMIAIIGIVTGAIGGIMSGGAIVGAIIAALCLGIGVTDMEIAIVALCASVGAGS